MKKNSTLPPRKCWNCRHSVRYTEGRGPMGCFWKGIITSPDSVCDEHIYTRRKLENL